MLTTVITILVGAFVGIIISLFLPKVLPPTDKVKKAANVASQIETQKKLVDLYKGHVENDKYAEKRVMLCVVSYGEKVFLTNNNHTSLNDDIKAGKVKDIEVLKSSCVGFDDHIAKALAKDEQAKLDRLKRRYKRLLNG